ncbi:hypothetical protein MMC12_007295 [Toensbergia leucococca]|nr:hypothetical protein [Toensbergia leucococca]
MPSACLPVPRPTTTATTATSTPLVFAHYMLITRPPSGNYTNDIVLAQAAGIDAFAINYGGFDAVWSLQEQYLSEFYSAAEALSFKVFLSIDTTSVTDPSMVVQLVNQYAGSPAQLTIDSAAMLSSFSTTPPNWNWQNDILDQITTAVHLVPGNIGTDASSLFSQAPSSGIFPWVHPYLTATEEATLDVLFAAERTATGKKWMAPIAPWFFKRFDVGDNWSQAQDAAIFVSRWQHLLQLQPDYIELVTWNDWGESSYLGPADTAESVPTAYWDTLDHSAFLKMAAVFIKAYKAGETSVSISAEDEDVFFFYRLQPATTLGSQDTLPLPLDASSLSDNVYIVSFLASPASIALTSGGVTTTIPAQEGVQLTGVPWTLGAQSLTATRNGETFVSKAGGPSISGDVSLYNGNVVAL